MGIKGYKDGHILVGKGQGSQGRQRRLARIGYLELARSSWVWS